MFKNLLAAGLLSATIAASAWPQDTHRGEAAIAPAGSPRITADWVSLPTDRETEAAVASLTPPELSPELSPDLARLLRPRWSLAAEWEPEADQIEVRDWDISVTVPTYPILGPPPPFLSMGFSYTDLLSPAELDLPPALYEFTLGASWMRRIDERWMLRFMLSTALATDLQNTSGDAWQLRGGVFALYDWRPDLQLLVGAFASGRADLPVLPGLGVLWTPTPSWHVNLMMPRPRISYLMLDRGDRQHWVFLGAGLSGGTWAFESDGLDDVITYREWRAGLGWEFGPPKTLSPAMGGGLQFETELGYVFGRTFEFDVRRGEIDVSDTLLVRTGVRF